MNFRERLTEKIKQKQSVVCVGLDPDITVDQFPRHLGIRPKLEFAKAIIDEVVDLIAVIKPNTRFYLVEEYRELEDIVKYAHKHDIEVIGDCKANDIGNTMACAYKKEFGYFDWDAITVNGYFGSNGIIGNEKTPIFKEWYKRGKGIFVLVKTSNKSSGQIQDVRVPFLNSEKTIWMFVAHLVEQCGVDYDFVIGSIVGATHPNDILMARKILSGIMLLPGYGAQGGKGEDVRDATADGKWCVVNSSRGVMYAYDRRFKGKFTQEEFAKAAREEVKFMNKDINRFIKSF